MIIWKYEEKSCACVCVCLYSINFLERNLLNVEKYRVRGEKNGLGCLQEHGDDCGLRLRSVREKIIPFHC